VKYLENFLYLSVQVDFSRKTIKVQKNPYLSGGDYIAAKNLETIK
jgi:hypothetical protein